MVTGLLKEAIRDSRSRRKQTTRRDWFSDVVPIPLDLCQPLSFSHFRAIIANAVYTRQRHSANTPPSFACTRVLSMEPRRTTLMNNGPLGNAFASSALPVPSSVMKKGPLRMAPGGGGARQSMLPGPVKSSMMGSSGAGGPGMTRTASQENLGGRLSIMPNRGADGGGYGASSANRGDGGMYGGRSSTASRPPPST